MLDGAILILDAVAGVQAQTKTVWKQISRQGIPSVVFVNKMDRNGANFERSLATVKKKLEVDVLPLQYPLGSEETFCGVVDLISMNRLIWRNDRDCRSIESPIVTPVSGDDSDFEIIQRERLKMIETLAEIDEVFMEVFFSEEAENIASSAIIEAIKRACLSKLIVPAVCGASLRGKGVEPLLDSIISFLPSPFERAPMEAVNLKTGKTKLVASDSPDLCALVFKVVYDAMRGPVSFIRIYSGTMHSKHVLINNCKGSKVRLNQLLKVSADELDNVEEVGAGNVCCAVGLKQTETGDTLVSEKSPLLQYTLKGLVVPNPVYSLSVKPERGSQQADLEKALHILCIEDPSLQFEIDQESEQTIVRGIGELHLEIVCDKLKRRFGLSVTTGKAYVAYRETLAEDAGTFEKSYTYDVVNNLKRLYAKLNFEVRVIGGFQPCKMDFSPTIISLLSPDEIEAVRDEMYTAFNKGPHGYAIVGIEITAKEAEKDTATTTPSALRACARGFIHSLLSSDKFVQLEPIMSIEVEVPNAAVGDVVNDLIVQRRAHIQEVVSDSSGTKQVISGLVPFANTLSYSTSLRSMTQGEGMFTMEFSTMEPVDLRFVENTNI